MPRGDRAFSEVTARNPCPICGGNGWCRVSREGAVVLCRREARGGRARVDRAGVVYYVHRLRGGDPVPIGDLVSRRVDALLAGRVPVLAPVEVRAEVYAATLRAMTLDAAHRDALRTRGLPDTEIDRREYRTLPPAGPPWTREALARALEDRYSPEVLAGVPGFVRRESRRTGRGYLTLTGSPGLLVPVRDLVGRIVALLSRPDTPPRSGAKYLWVTSNMPGCPGPSPGNLAHVPLPMSDSPEARGGTVAVYEGILKADIAAALDAARLPAVGIPGHNGWSAALPILRDMAPRTVRYFPDPDAWQKPEVGASLRAFWHALKAEGLTPEIGRFPDEA